MNNNNSIHKLGSVDKKRRTVVSYGYVDYNTKLFLYNYISVNRIANVKRELRCVNNLFIDTDKYNIICINSERSGEDTMILPSQCSDMVRMHSTVVDGYHLVAFPG